MDVLQLFERVSVDFARKQIRFKVPDGSGPAGNAAESIFARSRIRF